MIKRKHKFILLILGSYAIAVFCLSLHFIHRTYHTRLFSNSLNYVFMYTKMLKGFNETGIVYVRGNSYKVIQHKPKIRWCQPLKFVVNTTNRPTIALVSFPGSGNTWLRYLLQQATGILTGSVYKDYGLLWNGLYGESVMNESVSVVKTHEWGPSTRASFDKAILLIRSPGSAIQAEFNRRSGGHLGYASIDRFTRNQGREWAHFVMEKLESWRNMNLDWLRNFDKQMIVIYYEDLTREPKKYVEMIIPFVELTTTPQHLQCMMRRKEGIYRRRKPYLPFDPFSPELKNVLNSQWKVIRNEVTKRRRWKING